MILITMDNIFIEAVHSLHTMGGQKLLVVYRAISKFDKKEKMSAHPLATSQIGSFRLFQLFRKLLVRSTLSPC